MRTASDDEHDELRVHGLNLTVPEDAQALIKPWDERDDTSRFAESGVDDQVRASEYKVEHCISRARMFLQIIIHVPFTQNVRLRSVLLKLGRLDGAD